MPLRSGDRAAVIASYNNILYTFYASTTDSAVAPKDSVRAIRSLERPDSLSARIHADLRSRLQRGLVGPHERLVDVDIARAYGTSRMPAREALLRLVNEGYLVRTTRGFVVPALETDDVRHLFEVRGMLEPEAAASAAANLRAPDLAALGAALARARRAAALASAEEMIGANMDFRAAWLAGVKNPRLIEAVMRYVDHAQIVRLKTLTDPDSRQAALAGLEGLYQAFAARDRAAVRKRMKAFLLAAERAYHEAQPR